MYDSPTSAMSKHSVLNVVKCSNRTVSETGNRISTYYKSFYGVEPWEDVHHIIPKKVQRTLIIWAWKWCIKVAFVHHSARNSV
mmetsp:Transcript_24414/g.34146  ORF Transcript_24414/g.34146 Transcript_24414/m.34146 type:complete len:83 (+) Transcript_24414:435-683(+)